MVWAKEMCFLSIIPLKQVRLVEITLETVWMMLDDRSEYFLVLVRYHVVVSKVPS